MTNDKKIQLIGLLVHWIHGYLVVAVNCKLQTVNCILLAVNCQPSTANCLMTLHPVP